MGISMTLAGIVLAATALIQSVWGIMSSFLLFTFLLSTSMFYMYKLSMIQIDHHI